MNSSDTHVRTYLDDLARMLTDLDPGERDDVLAGIREHLDATLAEHPDDPGAVDAALLRLGPPERIAAEARAEHPPAAVTATRRRHHPVWGLVGVVASMVAILPVLVVPIGQRIAYVTYDPEAMTVWPSGLELAVLLAPLWILSIVALLLADRLPDATRSRLATLGPLALIGSASTGLWWSPEVLSSMVTVALLTMIAVATVRAGRKGWREARA